VAGVHRLQHAVREVAGRGAAAILFALLAAGATFAGRARAADSTFVLPQAELYYQVNDRRRAYFTAGYEDILREDAHSLILSANLDFSLKPILRARLGSDDWQRARYLWARIGYEHSESKANGVSNGGEDRGVLALNARAPFEDGYGLEARLRADLRWIDGAYSTRYRVRVEGNRGVQVRGYAVLPYARAEWFYDTRYDAWSRTDLYLGTEVAVDAHFRYEVSIARQDVRQPARSTTDGLRLIAKWYF
jgi:hypothetical protein